MWSLSVPFKDFWLEDEGAKNCDSLVNLPDADEFGLFAWRRVAGEHFERVDVAERQNCRCDEPRQAQERANGDAHANDQEIQMVSARFLEIIISSHKILSKKEKNARFTDLELEFFAVHDDRRDLLVHENKDGRDERWEDGDENSLQRVAARVDGNDPAAAGLGWLVVEDWQIEFGSVASSSRSNHLTAKTLGSVSLRVFKFTQ